MCSRAVSTITERITWEEHTQKKERRSSVRRSPAFDLGQLSCTKQVVSATSGAPPRSRARAKRCESSSSGLPGRISRARIASLHSPKKLGDLGQERLPSLCRQGIASERSMHLKNCERMSGLRPWTASVWMKRRKASVRA